MSTVSRAIISQVIGDKTMMTYQVDWVENKQDDWKIATLKEVVEGGQTYENVSINKVTRDGRPFPGFENIAPGSVIAGNIWLSPKNQKWSLFPPDPVRSAAPRPAASPSAAPTRGPAGIKAAQERKDQMIEKAQENKGKGMLIAAAFRDATLMLVNMADYKTMTPDESKMKHKALRDWYIAEYKDTEKTLDVPF